MVFSESMSAEDSTSLIRDITSSDPLYVVVRMGKQKLKTRVVKKNLNHEWNDHLTLSIIDPVLSIHLMGDAHIHIGLFLEALRNAKLRGLPVGTVIARIQPSRDICLAEESCIVRDDQGGLTQSMILRLRYVESGEVELELQWIDVPGFKRLRTSPIRDLHANRLKRNSIVS